MRKGLKRILAVIGIILISPMAAPQLLAFPHSASIGAHRVYSEAPISPRLAAIVEKADDLVAASPLGHGAPKDQSIFLTDGGWRWKFLALNLSGSFAFSRPYLGVNVFNRSDQDRDRVMNGRAMAGTRSLHGVIAHEMAHDSIRSHFGPTADWRYPVELREGYCDFVAGGGSLSDAEAEALIASGGHVPALTYWRGRKKVEAELRRNGGAVDALFAGWRS